MHGGHHGYLCEGRVSAHGAVVTKSCAAVYRLGYVIQLQSIAACLLALLQRSHQITVDNLFAGLQDNALSCSCVVTLAMERWQNTALMLMMRAAIQYCTMTPALCIFMDPVVDMSASCMALTMTTW